MKIELKKSKKVIVKIGSSVINNSNEEDYLSDICNELSLIVPLKFINEIIILLYID